MSKSERDKERGEYFKKAKQNREKEISTRQSDDPVFYFPSSHSPDPSASVVLIQWLQG